ncbi:MAG: hypothetical protein IPO81_29305 [Kouleothrix sp.]|nr:hypothetical protein [Kouleothrix sp.]
MKTSTAADLERTLLRAGDDLYRLALLLAPSPAAAAHALLAATRRLAAADAGASEPALLAALRAALPPDRRFWPLRRRPAWARPAANHPQPQLLRALAALPQPQRLLLGLTLLRGFEPAQAAPLLGLDEPTVRVQLRATLLALAPAVSPVLPLPTLDPTQAPPDCQPTRTALASDAPALHEDPTIRGHLALCSACRAADQAWAALAATVDQTLRGALRDRRVPPDLTAQLQAATRPSAAPAERRRLDDPRVRIALVIVPVLALIAVLVAPRGAPTPPGSTGGAPTIPVSDPQALVRRAAGQLYAPPSGEGTWHSRYAIQLVFPNHSSAPVVADLWIDPAAGRYRAQLVHRDGGGPYELGLADGTGSAWYAVSDSYAPTLYPMAANGQLKRVQFQATPEQQRALLAAQLQAGAWSIAASYLRQAAQAELHTWGRQPDADGRMLTLLSFRGASPLGLPPDAPSAAEPLTILLAIDPADGRLREVRELAGAAEGEQTARTTWRALDEEWLAEPAAADTFNLRRAWNGVGNFDERDRLVDPAFPLLDVRFVVPPAQALQYNVSGLWMPATAPPGATAAILVDRAFGSPETQGYVDPTNLTLLYAAGDRRLAIRTVHDSTISLRGGESIELSGRQFTLLPGPAQSYQAQALQQLPWESEPVRSEISASGYSRAELLGVLRTLGPPTLEIYRGQATLFADRRPHDAAFEALLGALAPPPAPLDGGARHFVERVFKRQAKLPDLWRDPYHIPPYGGWPEQWTQDNWSRGSVLSGTLEASSVTTGAAGKVIASQYRGLEESWDYNAPSSRVYRFSTRALGLAGQTNEEQGTVLRMIGCGGAVLQAGAGGARSIVLSEPQWSRRSCQNPIYPELLRGQITNGAPVGVTDQAPYLNELDGSPLTTVIDLGAAGRPVRTQVWSGLPGSGTLLESWELVSEELVPPERVPAAAFEATPPEATVRFTEPNLLIAERRPLETIGITEALSLATSPLFGLPAAPGAAPGEATLSLDQITTGPPPDDPHVHWYSDQDSVFEHALWDGYALRLSYTLRQGDAAQTVQLYQGQAGALGAYLRDQARWSRSAPESAQVGDRKIDGWRVGARGLSAEWLIFEVDGTLIALENPTIESLAALQRLERIRSSSSQ